MAELSDNMEPKNAENNYLSGQMLIAMPGMTDPRFEKAVIYICAHNEDGAMGVVVFRPIESMNFRVMLKQLDIDPCE